MWNYVIRIFFFMFFSSSASICRLLYNFLQIYILIVLLMYQTPYLKCEIMW